jgi:hypothetical protein
LEKFQRPTIDDISPGGLYNFTKIFLTNTSIRPKKYMCVYGHPTDPNFCWRLYQFLHRMWITIFVV